MAEAFNEYPITLAHPAFAPATSVAVPGSQIYDRAGNIIRQDFQGTAQRLPPVTANDAYEEEYYRAQGYERAGQMDPSAWVRAHADTPSVDYNPVKYPLWRGGVLIMTAQEDIEATDDDLAPPVVIDEPKPAPPAQSSEAENLRSQMEEMNRQMAQMMENSQAMAQENARLKAERESSIAVKRVGRPRKDA
jgi:hypothetical protein